MARMMRSRVDARLMGCRLKDVDTPILVSSSCASTAHHQIPTKDLYHPDSGRKAPHGLPLEQQESLILVGNARLATDIHRIALPTKTITAFTTSGSLDIIGAMQFVQGTLYLIELDESKGVWSVDAAGVPTKVADGGHAWGAPDAMVYEPGSDTFLVGDSTRLLRLPRTGGAVVEVGTGFGQVSGLTFGADGALYVADQGDGVIWKVPGPSPVAYCTSGTSASGCTASISATGTASATAPTGFTLDITCVEGSKDGLYFFGTSGRQANSWGNGTSYQCVVPPVKRAGLLLGTGTVGLCDGSFSQDLNARWAAKPAQNPGAGAVVQAQLWYRDPFNTSNQTTSLSDAIEFTVEP